jgi:hypothetical protein
MADKLDEDRKRENLQGRIVGGQFQPWGGACRCRQCVTKSRRPGFYIAPRLDYERDGREDWSKMYVPGKA